MKKIPGWLRFLLYVVVWLFLIAVAGGPWGDFMHDKMREFTLHILIIGVPFFSLCFWITTPFERRYK